MKAGKRKRCFPSGGIQAYLEECHFLLVDATTISLPTEPWELTFETLAVHPRNCTIL